MRQKSQNMSDIGDPEKSRYVETVRGPYLSAVFNPDSDQFRQMESPRARTILEIGCGVNPRLSWGLNSGDLWVGCDPAATKGIVIKGERPVKRSAGLVIFPYKAEELAEKFPGLKPDVISIVAPNQEDIVKRRIFNDGLKKFLDPEKEQVMIVVLDTRTVEAEQYQEEAKQIIRDWRSNNGFKPDTENLVLDDFKLNSADTVVKNIKLCYVRNSEK
jgi:hypothetical protein